MGFNTTVTILPAGRSQVVAATTAVAVSDGPSSGFIPDDDGPLTCRLFNDPADVVLQVFGGSVYPLAISNIPVANERPGVLLFHK